jgi:enoyl-[acyl-carrier protein] reductase II
LVQYADKITGGFMGIAGLIELLDIRYPIIQGGMIWCSDAKLVAAVSNAGGLGLIGAAGMNAADLQNNILQTREMTSRPFGVNIPVLYKHARDLVEVSIENKADVVFTSAGSPKRFTPKLHAAGIKVFHVVSTPAQAVKCQAANVDGIVAEGYEAGGHNGREEITTIVLVPQVVDAVSIPVVAAGGIADGRGLAAAFALGASGVQMGTRFVLTKESTCHPNFKQACLEAGPENTLSVLKKGIPIRMMKCPLRDRIIEAENRGASKEELLEILGIGKSKIAMVDGNLEEGLLEIGQIAGMLDDIPSVEEVIQNLINQYNENIDACKILS